MKKLATILLAAFVVAGCAQQNIPPQAPIIGKTNADKQPEELYTAMVQCVLDNISPPSLGQLFTYQSEKDSQLVLVYHFSNLVSDMLGVKLYWESRATMRFDGKRDELRIQNLQYKAGINYPWSDYSEQNGTTWANSAYKMANDMNKKLVECVPTYL